MIDSKEIFTVSMVMIFVVCGLMIIGFISVGLDNNIDTTYSNTINIIGDISNGITDHTGNYHLNNIQVQAWNGTAWNTIPYTYTNGDVIISAGNL